MEQPARKSLNRGLRAFFVFRGADMAKKIALGKSLFAGGRENSQRAKRGEGGHFLPIGQGTTVPAPARTRRQFFQQGLGKMIKPAKQHEREEKTLVVSSGFRFLTRPFPPGCIGYLPVFPDLESQRKVENNGHFEVIKGAD